MTQPQYILLAEGETVREGDEFYSRQEKWLPVGFGIRYEINSTHTPHRRKIEGWREIKDASNIGFPCALAHYDEALSTMIAIGEVYGHYTHWLPLPLLPPKQSEAETAWAVYWAKNFEGQFHASEGKKADFIAGFEAGRKK